MRKLLVLLVFAAVCAFGSGVAQACTGAHETEPSSISVTSSSPLSGFEVSAAPLPAETHAHCAPSCAGGCGCGCGCACVGAAAAVNATPRIDHPPLARYVPAPDVLPAEPRRLTADLSGPPRISV